MLMKPDPIPRSTLRSLEESLLTSFRHILKLELALLGGKQYSYVLFETVISMAIATGGLKWEGVEETDSQPCEY